MLNRRKEVIEMTAIHHEPVPDTQRWSLRLLVPEMWASLAIVVIWLAVLFTAIYGPDLVATTGVADIGDSTTVPSVVLVAPFAFLGTWVVAKYGFGHERKE
jgi:hypothetical protein